MREIANTLSFGTPAEVSSVVGSLTLHDEDLSAELIPLLEPMIGDNQERWAEVGTNFLVSQPSKRLTIAELLTAKAEDQKTLRARNNLALLQTAFQKLKDSPQTHSLLIHQLIAEAAFHSSGAVIALLEYTEDPITLQTLRKALADNTPGSFYIARHTREVPRDKAWVQQVPRKNATRQLVVASHGSNPAAFWTDAHYHLTVENQRDKSFIT